MTKSSPPFRPSLPPGPFPLPIGLIGGLSWHSTALYYACLNQIGEARNGAQHNPPSMIDTLPFADVMASAARDDWADIERRFVDAGKRLQHAGCPVVALTAVTAHRVHAGVQAALDVPVPHIFDAVSARLADVAPGRIGVVATSRTLADPALLDRLSGRHQLLLPDRDRRERLDRLIYDRLTLGLVDSGGRRELEETLVALIRSGADTLLLACTELPLLKPLFSENPGDFPIIIDAVEAHVGHLLTMASDNDE